MATPVQDLVDQAEDFVLLGVEGQTIVAQIAAIEAADRSKVGNGVQSGVVQFGGVMQDQDDVLVLPHLLERVLAVVSRTDACVASGRFMSRSMAL